MKRFTTFEEDNEEQRVGPTKTWKEVVNKDMPDLELMRRSSSSGVISSGCDSQTFRVPSESSCSRSSLFVCCSYSSMTIILSDGLHFHVLMFLDESSKVHHKVCIRRSGKLIACNVCAAKCSMFIFSKNA